MMTKKYSRFPSNSEFKTNDLKTKILRNSRLNINVLTLLQFSYYYYSYKQKERKKKINNIK